MVRGFYWSHCLNVGSSDLLSRLKNRFKRRKSGSTNPRVSRDSRAITEESQRMCQVFAHERIKSRGWELLARMWLKGKSSRGWVSHVDEFLARMLERKVAQKKEVVQIRTQVTESRVIKSDRSDWDRIEVKSRGKNLQRWPANSNRSRELAKWDWLRVVEIDRIDLKASIDMKRRSEISIERRR